MIHCMLSNIYSKQKSESMIMAEARCSQLSLSCTALLFILTVGVSAVSGQSTGEWFISEGELIQR